MAVLRLVYKRLSQFTRITAITALNIEHPEVLIDRKLRYTVHRPLYPRDPGKYYNFSGGIWTIPQITVSLTFEDTIDMAWENSQL